jgi:hypothetical protein
VQQLLPSVQLPGAAGSEAACTAAHQQLQQQCGELQQQLGPLDEPSSEAAVSWVTPSRLRRAASEAALQLPQGVAAAVLQFGLQLVQFGGALCAQLPVPLCCNNPGCVVLRGASEQ